MLQGAIQIAEYSKNVLSDIISVDSIVTILHMDLKGKEPIGEAHDFWEFLYVEKGSRKTSVDDTVYTIEEGQLMMFAPLSYHVGLKPNDATVNVVSFESSSKLMHHFANKVITLSGKQRQILSKIMSIGKKCFKIATPDSGFKGMVPREGVDTFELQNLKNLLELLLIDMYVKNESTSSKPSGSNYENYSNNTFNLLTHYLKNNIEKSLTLKDICNDCAISLSQLKRVCQNQCGMSPMSYFISLKIDEAKAMISDTSLNFTQISENLGFTTVHYFSKLFKNKVGVSPSEYAKSVYKK